MSHYSLPSGTKLGENYEIRGLLGSGGFGITYEAWDVEFQRVVAIKEYFPFDLTIRLPGSNMVVPRDDGAKGDFEKGMAQFVEEGRTLAKFADNTIVRATNFVKMNDTVYMVMEYQEGSPLSKFMTEQDGPLSEERILGIFVPVMKALEKVHRAEILHRDLKPDNIYIRNDGTPVLLDFGAARQKVAGKTRSLTSMLSPGYAPLEQYHTRGNQGPWTDIYALGATMYYCTTGKRPEDVTARMGASHTGTPDPMPLATVVARGMYSEKLLSIIDWMLRLNERDRPQSLAEVLDRLEEIESKPRATAVLSPVQTKVVTSNIRREDVSSEAKTEKINIEPVDTVRPSLKSGKSGKSGKPIALYSLLGLIVVVLAGLGFIQWSKQDDQVTNVERKILPEETPSEAAPVSTDREEATRLAEEQRQKEEAARLAEEQRRKEEAARLAEEQRQKEEAARLAEEQRQKEEAARLAEEQRRKEEAARLAEEQRQKEEAARLAEEQRQKEEAARLAEEQRQKEEAVRLAEEQRQKEEAARLAEEQRQKEEAARLAEEQRRKEEAVRLAEEQRQKEEAARLAEEQRQKEEAARLAEEQRQKEEAARLAEEQRQKEEAARLAEEQRQKEEAARLAEEQRQKEEAARLAEEQRQKEEAARLAEEQRQKEEAARLAEEQRQKEEAARLAEEQRQKEEAARLAEEQRQKEEAARLAEEQRQKEEAARLAEEQRKEEEPEKLTEEEKAARDQLLWRETKNTDTRNSYQAYLEKCVLCINTMVAISRINEMWKEEAEKLAEEQRKKEEAARIGE